MALSVEEIKERLASIVSTYGGGFPASDAYETNARGGSSEREEAKADGRDEVCDEINDLLRDIG